MLWAVTQVLYYRVTQVLRNVMFSAHSQVFTGEMGQKKRRKCLSQA